MRLIFVHGRSQHGKIVSALRLEWETALRSGMSKAGLPWPDGVDLRFPFYGDLLDNLVRQLDSPLVADIISRGAAPDSREDEFRGEFLAELVAGSGIPESEVDRFYTGPVLERGPRNWEWVHSLLKALDRTPLGSSAIDAFTRDVYVYLSNRTVRKRIKAVVEADLKAGPCVVVAHSLGTIVAYNVLQDADPAVGVRRFVTLGSPLGIRSIRDRLDPPVIMPRCTTDWYNALDERDVVSLYPLDDSRFPVLPSIRNNVEVDNRFDDRHNIVGYLEVPEVAREIWEALTRA